MPQIPSVGQNDFIYYFFLNHSFHCFTFIRYIKHFQYLVFGNNFIYLIVIVIFCLKTITPHGWGKLFLINPRLYNAHL
jgi:hypothetical protein